MVFDEIYVKDGTQLLPIDSIENQPIEEIIYEGQVCHFAKQSDVTGTSDVVAENGVEEPIRSLSVSGATLQSGTPTPEAPIPIQNANDNGSGVNIFTTEGAVTGNILRTGTPEANGNYKTTDFLEVKENQYYRLMYRVNREYTNAWVLNRSLWCYDINKTPLKNLYIASPPETGVQDIIFQIPSGAKYIRFSWFSNTAQKYDTEISIVSFFGVNLRGKNLALATDVYSTGAGYQLIDVEDTDYGITRKCVRFQTNTAKYVTNGGFKENTPYTVSFMARKQNLESTITAQPFCFWYTDGTFQMVGGQANVQQKFSFVKGVSNANKTIAYIGVYAWNSGGYALVDIDTFMLQEGAIADPVYEPYFRETVEIPTSIDVNGTNVPLLFSKYDKLTVDRVNNEVIYHRKSVLMSFTGQESQWSSKQTGYYQIFPEMFPPYWSPDYDKGYCTHFKKYEWNPFYNNNGFAVAGAFIFRTDGTQTLNEFKEMLQEQYANGTPVTILYGKAGTAREHDITNTDLGQSLLALATGKGTNYLEITSNLAPSQTDLSYWEQIVPETT